VTRIVVAQHEGAEHTDFESLLAAARPTFFDVVQTHREPGLFIGVATYFTEPEDETAPGLSEDRERDLWLAWDGRIDGRDDLCRELGAPTASSSAELALRAYCRWGNQTPQHLLGDFAMVVVDRKSKRIFAARDRFGLRSLVVAKHRAGRIIASDERLLFAMGVSREPDVEAAGRYIVGAYVPVEDTLYRDVRNVPSGGSLEIDGEKQVSCRYFDPDVDEQKLSDQDHVDRIRAALTAAVADRSRGQRLIASDASGGVDSSTIVALLAAQLREAGREPPLLLHMRCIGMPCDEGRYARALANHVEAPLFEADGAQTRFGPEGIPELDLPDVWCASSHVLHEEAHRRGARVCFTGQGSDELQFRYFLVEDGLATGHWLDAARFAGLYDEPLGRAAWMKLMRAGLRTWGPKRWFAQRDDRRAAARLPSWLAPRGREVALKGVLTLDHFADAHPHPSPLRRASHAELVFSQQTTIFSQAEMSFGRAHGLELANPYSDARVVAAFVALPTRLRASVEIPKPTLRAIAREILPPGLAWKYPGMDYAPFLHAGWLRAKDDWLEISRGLELAALGLVDGEKLRKATETGFLSGRLGWDVHTALKVEAWLRRLRVWPQTHL